VESGQDVEPPPLELEEIHRDKLSLIGQMASSIAHEISNPLATIVAAAQTVIASWPRPQDGTLASPIMQQLAEDMDLILAEARRAGEIVHGLLASARRHAPERRVISLMAVTKRAASLCRHHLRLYDIVLHGPETDGEDQSPMWSRLEGDANQLHQVLLNLLVNAQHAISGHRTRGNVWLSVAPAEEGYIRIRVEDDGPGISVEPRERIFEPFFTTKPTGKGTGLGLTISAGIIAGHKGRISVRERQGGGTVFEILLPSLALQRRGRDADPPAAITETLEQAAPRKDETSPAGRRILLVDDEPGIRQSVSRFLQRRGHLVTAAASGREAMEALRCAPYDAVISDLRMPDLGGEELYAMMLREFPQMANRVIFTSGDLMREETRAFLARTGCPALGKPYELDQLVRIINGLCSAATTERRATA
jgi:two-component system NtrC family sensor kinase